MTDTAISEIRQLRSELSALRVEFAKLASLLSPWIGTDEMRARYGVTLKTLTEWERSGKIPCRVHGRWNRTQVLEWESAQKPNRFTQNLRTT